ncbi:hypothetical protein FJU08_11185 [Martelella alba]|uniref:Uncharacterized protein n=1 Tax=Martelella alba TaxID=2590451 RepID=A0A506U9H9_9HYPH|nr:hypothetical protein FJU08_11185 [Martelella alba]
MPDAIGISAYGSVAPARNIQSSSVASSPARRAGVAPSRAAPFLPGRDSHSLSELLAQIKGVPVQENGAQGRNAATLTDVYAENAARDGRQFDFEGAAKRNAAPQAQAYAGVPGHTMADTDSTNASGGQAHDPAGDAGPANNREALLQKQAELKQTLQQIDETGEKFKSVAGKAAEFWRGQSEKLRQHRSRLRQEMDELSKTRHQDMARHYEERFKGLAAASAV